MANATGEPERRTGQLWSGIYPNFCSDVEANGHDKKFEKHCTSDDFKQPASYPEEDLRRYQGESYPLEPAMGLRVLLFLREWRVLQVELQPGV